MGTCLVCDRCSTADRSPPPGGRGHSGDGHTPAPGPIPWPVAEHHGAAEPKALVQPGSSLPRAAARAAGGSPSFLRGDSPAAAQLHFQRTREHLPTKEPAFQQCSAFLEAASTRE